MPGLPFLFSCRAALLVCATTVLCTADSRAQVADTSAVVRDTAASLRTPLFRRIGDTLWANIKAPVLSKPLSWKAVVIPTVLVGYGTLSFTSDWVKDVNIFGRSVASTGEDPDRKTSVDDYSMFVPAVAVYGLHIGGLRGRNNLVDATLLYALSNTLANGIVVSLKAYTITERPDSSDVKSFPSGHTSTAFVSAEFLRQEYKDISPWIGVAGYGVAVATGYLRMYNNRHWFSDVMAGAGIGILSTRLTYWLYPKLKNMVVRKASGTTIILPAYGNGYVGFTAVRRF